LEHNGSQINVSIIALIRTEIKILTPFRHLLYVRRVVYTGASHVITSLIPRLLHTVQYPTESWGGAWE